METVIKSQKVKEVKLSNEPTLKTGNEKFDNWLSNKGGLVKGSSILLSGTSGAGKTSLMLNLMSVMSNTVISMYEREVSLNSVCEQTSNVKPKHSNAYIADKKTHPHFNDYIKELNTLKPEIVILDSIQAVAMEDFTELSEEDALNHISKILRTWAEENNAVVFIISHNTKAGDYKGAACLKQLIDIHMIMNFDKKTNERTITFSKNRKGAVDSMFYIFTNSGIEFFTTEEWELRTEKRDFRESFINFANKYVSNINSNTKAGDKFLEEYNKEVKKINKSNDGNEICLNLLNLLMELSDKHENI
nr:hypothetical protein [uncultured archaeon]